MVLIACGLGVVLFTLTDVFVTTVSMRGAGPLSSRLMNHIWRPAATSTRLSHRGLEIYGSLMLPLAVVIWGVLLYAGWALVFLAGPDAVVEASSGAPAGWWDRIYFTGYTISTLGNGELRPDGGVWQGLTVAASVTGLALITLAITYVTPVMSAVVTKRRVARMIVALGPTPTDVLDKGWDGQSFQRIASHMTNLAPALADLAQQHMAYPVLHYFHPAERATALAPAVAVLDDALTLLRFGVAPAHRLDPVTLHTTMAAIDVLLSALQAAHIDPADRAPDVPPLSVLERLDVPTVTDDEYRADVDGLTDRRALLLGFVENDGWSWST